MAQLIPMSREEFERYLESRLHDYAKDMTVVQDLSQAEAEARARKQYSQLLPNGFDTDGHYFCNIVDGDAQVGQVWFFHVPAQEQIFLSDLIIHEAHRREGYGTEALRLVEEKAKELNCGAVWLHVFAHNTGAQAFYRKAGYKASGIQMCKFVE